MRNEVMRYAKKFSVISVLLALSLSCAGCADASSAEQVVTPEVTAEVTAAAQLANQAAAATSAPNWNIQAEGSHIHFSAEQEGETFTGSFGEFSGRILFDPETPESSAVDITIPLTSVDAGSRDRNSTLPGKVWFSVKKFPDARFTSSSISKQDEGYLAKGELTLKGKSLPLDLPFDLQISGERAVMTGQVILDRTLWNVGAAPWDTDEWVSRQVKLDIQVTADR